LAGNIFIIYRSRWGFAIWTAANIGWITANVMGGIQAQAALFGAYTALSVWGFLSWRSVKK